MKKITKALILIIITMFLMTINVYAADFSVKMEKTEQENEITLQIKLESINITGAGINAFTCDLEYDRDVFETVTSEDITAQNGWEDLTYNEKSGSLLTLRNDFTKTTGDAILTVKLHEKATAKSGKTEIKLTGIQASDSQQDLEAEDQVIEVQIGGLNIIKILITIIIVIAILIVILFIIRFLVKSTNKRRKRR